MALLADRRSVLVIVVVEMRLWSRPFARASPHSDGSNSKRGIHIPEQCSNHASTIFSKNPTKKIKLTFFFSLVRLCRRTPRRRPRHPALRRQECQQGFLEISQRERAEEVRRKVQDWLCWRECQAVKKNKQTVF